MVTTAGRSLLTLLDDMRSMIERIDEERYAAPARGRSRGPIGAHVRHCLDHVSALITATTQAGAPAIDARAVPQSRPADVPRLTASQTSKRIWRNCDMTSST